MPCAPTRTWRGPAQDNLHLRSIDVSSNDRTVSTLAGVEGSRTSGYLDGTASTALLNLASDVAITKAGNLAFSDTNNNRIR